MVEDLFKAVLTSKDRVNTRSCVNFEPSGLVEAERLEVGDEPECPIFRSEHHFQVRGLLHKVRFVPMTARRYGVGGLADSTSSCVLVPKSLDDVWMDTLI